MAHEIKIDGKLINSIFRRSELKYVFIFNSFFSLLIIAIINIIFYTIDSDVYLVQAFKHNFIFNLFVINIIFLITTNMYAYYLYIEARIQFKNRKYYLTTENNYQRIFDVPLSLAFSLLLTFFTGFMIINYWSANDPTFDPITMYVAVFFIFFLIPGVAIFYYYYQGIKFILFKSLSFWNNISSSIKKELNDEIYSAKLNNTNFWLIKIKILNLKEIAKQFSKPTKQITKVIIRSFRIKVRNSDFVLAFDLNNGMIGYLVNNDKRSTEMLLDKKIKPYLADNIIYKDKPLELEVEYKIEDVARNEEINNVKDLYQFAKKNIN